MKVENGISYPELEDIALESATPNEIDSIDGLLNPLIEKMSPEEYDQWVKECPLEERRRRALFWLRK